MKTRFATSMIALSTAIAAPAAADVTAADVWSNQQAFYSAMGISLGGTLSGDTLKNPEMNIILPEGAASLQIRAEAIKLADNGDGTVTVSYQSPMNVTIAGGAQGEGAFTAELSMTQDGYTVIASGNPGDITYIADAQNVRFDLTDATLNDPTAEDFDMTGFLSMAYWTGISQVTEGNLISYTSTSEVGDSTADFTFTVDNVISQSVQNTQPLQSVVTALLPVGGSDIMNLSAALRDGLSVALESSGGGSDTKTNTTLDGSVMNSQTASYGAQTFAVSLNGDGMTMVADSADFTMKMNDPMIFPGDLEFAMERITANYDVPLNASNDTQDFRVATSLQGLTLGDAIWDLFDPAGQLPRDPAEISFDVTGMGTNGTDLLDFAALSQMFGPPAIEIDEITIENLNIAAVGAQATATGAMTFDWTDFTTIPGIARPEGQVTVNLNGANKLMDTLAAMGLIPEDQLMMPRMMMGMFATPVGDDMLETVLEVNSDGQVLANGQRLQ